MANGKIPKTIRELYFFIKSEFDRLDSIQSELTEHKNNHWKVIGIMIGITGINVTVFIFIIKYFSSKGAIL